MYSIKVKDSEIDAVIGACIEADMNGSNFPGMTYEQGVQEALHWIIGVVPNNPLSD